MLNNNFVVFDNTFEGLMTIVYLHYYEKLNPDNIINDQNLELKLNTNYIKIQTDNEKALKVMKAIIDKLSKHIFDHVYISFMSVDDERYFDIYNFILFAFGTGKDTLNYLENKYVLKIIKHYKYVKKESIRVREFSRFAETENGVFYSPINPINNVLPLVCEFFVDRFNDMFFIIHDVDRGIVGIYDKKQCVFKDAPKHLNLNYTDKEKEYQKLWGEFFIAIVNKDRINPKCQNLFLPKRYRKYLTEFNYELTRNNEENIKNNIKNNKTEFPIKI